MNSDIQTRRDIEILINKFYDKAKQDTLLGPVFSRVDWPRHLPTMYNFWASMLLGDQSYQGNPFQKHLHLTINSTHFNRWLELFTQTIDENFSGPKADETKSRAQSIAEVWKFKMGFD